MAVVGREGGREGEWEGRRVGREGGREGRRVGREGREGEWERGCEGQGRGGVIFVWSLLSACYFLGFKRLSNVAMDSHCHSGM